MKRSKGSNHSEAIARLRREEGWNHTHFRLKQAKGSAHSSSVPMDPEADAAEYIRLACAFCRRDVGMFGTTFPCDYCNEYSIPVELDARGEVAA